MIIKDCKFETILIDSRCLRKGILVHLYSSDGRKTVTEASPLPGYSKETFELALSQLRQLKRKLLSTWWTKGSLHTLSTFGLYPSVHFAIESALNDLLHPLVSNEVPIQKYGLLFGSAEEILSRAEEISAEGQSHAKIKLGHFSPEAAHKIVKQLQDRFLLRVDLNKKWPFADTLAFCAHYPKDYFYYIEEPCSNVNDALRLEIPFALDESLLNLKSLAPFLQSIYLKALILKPTLIYPLHSYLHLGPEIVMSSSFESSLGIAQIKRLIVRLGLTHIKHGLDTLRYFDHFDALPDCQLEKTVP